MWYITLQQLQCFHCFVQGYKYRQAYIATQGCLAETTEDFWRMLWEHNSTIIVMLTKLREMGRVGFLLVTRQVFLTVAKQNNITFFGKTKLISPTYTNSKVPFKERKFSTDILLKFPERGCKLLTGWWDVSFFFQEKCHQYWPSERSARYQYFVVDPMAEYNMPQYILREFKVTDARVSLIGKSHI